MKTAMPVVAEDDDVVILRQLVQLHRYLAHGDVSGSGHGTNVYFPGFTHIQNEGRFRALVLPLS